MPGHPAAACLSALPADRMTRYSRGMSANEQSIEHVRILPIHVANKIAAGEVVDRPASVVKELVENALDARARQIDVEITAGGRKLIAVTDDGSGMARDDALLSVERHATSKIHDVDDIERIATLGFRGEALAAVASVSRFRLLTCRAGEPAGTELTIVGGSIQDVRDVGSPPGTRIEVRDLFFNVPARRKFLRSYQTEMAHVRDAFMTQALAHPEVGMSLTIDSRPAHGLAAGGEVADRIRDLFGADYARRLCAVSHESFGVRVHGFVSLPGMNRVDRNEQYFFVNRRATSAPVLHAAVREGYHDSLPRGRQPSVFLFLDIDPSGVDVNVHPTKKEVRFRQPGAVRDAVIAAIRGALRLPGGPRDDAPGGPFMPPGLPDAAPGGETQMRIEDLPPAHAFRYPRMAGAVTLPASGGTDPRDGAGSAGEQAQPGGTGEPVVPARGGEVGGAEPSAGGAAPWSWCRVLGQIGGLYIVLETEDGMVLMDPRAAHERVLFERLMAQARRGDVQSQSLLLPETVPLSPADAARLRKHLDVLQEMGFGVSEFGGGTFLVDAAPVCLGGVSAGEFLREIPGAMDEAGGRGARGRWREEVVAEAACRAAVRSRDKLSLEAIERLVVDLAGTEMPYTSPRGRPTLVFTSLSELHRKFGRSSAYSTR